MQYGTSDAQPSGVSLRSDLAFPPAIGTPLHMLICKFSAVAKFVQVSSSEDNASLAQAHFVTPASCRGQGQAGGSQTIQWHGSIR